MTLPTIGPIRTGKGEASHASELSEYVGPIGALLCSVTLRCMYTIMGCGYHRNKGSSISCVSYRNEFNEQRPNPSIPSVGQQAGAEWGGVRPSLGGLVEKLSA